MLRSKVRGRKGGFKQGGESDWFGLNLVGQKIEAKKGQVKKLNKKRLWVLLLVSWGWGGGCNKNFSKDRGGGDKSFRGIITMRRHKGSKEKDRLQPLYVKEAEKNRDNHCSYRV